MTDFNFDTKFLKVHDPSEENPHGLLLGFAIVCKENGEDYFDTGEFHEDTNEIWQDHIPEASMLEAALDFMKSERVACDMHAREGGEPVADGQVVFAFPLTTEIAKSLEIETPRTGLLVGIQPENPETLEKVRSGVYTGFSMGGHRIRDEVVE